MPVTPVRGQRPRNRLKSPIADDFLKRVPPHSPEAETGVLAGVLIRPQVISSIADILKPEDFYLPAHVAIYTACLNLFSRGTPIDLVTLGQELHNSATLEDAGGANYLASLAGAVVTGANAEHYANIVRDKSLQRHLIGTCTEIVGKCFEPNQTVEQLLDESEQAVFSISSKTSRNTFSTSEELLTKVFDDLGRLANARDVVTGVSTGFERLDFLTTGLQKSDLIIVAARPSMGKTAFALCMALNAATSQNIPVAIFSLEMSKEQLMQRLLAVRGRVNLSSLRKPGTLTDEDWAALHAAADVLAKAPIYIDDSPGLSTLELRARARRLKAEKGLGLVVVDYLQLMRSSRKTDSRELEISDISRSLKALAKELDIPVVALAQLNRKVEDRTDKRPILADLRESGAIEQDADVIMFVYREDVYKFKKPSERPDEGDAEIIIGKQRNGPVGVAELMYLSKYTSFENRASAYMPSEDLQ